VYLSGTKLFAFVGNEKLSACEELDRPKIPTFFSPMETTESL
jgi:hypothetical protein